MSVCARNRKIKEEKKGRTQDDLKGWVRVMGESDLMAKSHGKVKREGELVVTRLEVMEVK